MTETPNPLDIAAELEGFAEGSTSARASLMRDAAAVIRSLIPEPPTDDEREALISVLRTRSIWHSLAPYEEDADAIIEWRNRHRIPTQVEYAARWVLTEGQPVTDKGEPLEDLRALALDQEGYVEVVQRFVSEWETLGL